MTRTGQADGNGRTLMGVTFHQKMFQVACKLSVVMTVALHVSKNLEFADQ